jgi:hypothetical protein
MEKDLQNLDIIKKDTVINHIKLNLVKIKNKK